MGSSKHHKTKTKTSLGPGLARLEENLSPLKMTLGLRCYKQRLIKLGGDQGFNPGSQERAQQGYDQLETIQKE